MVGSVTGFAALKSPAAWMLPASVLVIVLSTSLLSGCATGTASAVDASARQAEPMTAFDEPEVRRRARIRLQLAGSYFEQGQTTVALDELKQAIAIDPTFADAYNLRGLIYMRMNEPGLAEESFRRSIALNPRDASAHHNYGWMLCQQKRFPEGDKLFAQAVANPTYAEKSKTFMAQGLCQISAGQPAEEERTLVRAYELDAVNPITGYNLAQLLFARGDFVRAQFYIRRLNNGEYANAESLWLGIKVERQLNDSVAMSQLASQLRRRFPVSKELAAYERGAFNE